ncbi:MAG: HEAT repeat domain-containing protein [Planctomycetota bacterium]
MHGRPSAALKSSRSALGLTAFIGPAFTCLLVLSMILLPGSSAQAQEETFAEALDLFQRGHADEARQKFEDVLAQNPSHEQALAMYRMASEQVWLQMLLESDPYEAIAKRFGELARLGRKGKAADAERIRELVGQIASDDYAAMRQAKLTLMADHGPYAVTGMWTYLGDENATVRVNMMLALTDLGSDAVLPLVQVLGAEDERVRANAAATLGSIGDQRALPALRALATGDTSDVVKRQATDALAKLGGAGDQRPAALWCDLAAKYFAGESSVVRPQDPFRVVWSFTDGQLEGREVPWGLYRFELAEQACYAALALDPSDTRAHEILLAAYAGEKAEILESQAAGEDVGETGGEMAAELVPALDVVLAAGGGETLLRSLALALDKGVNLAAGVLCDMLGQLGMKGPSVERALDSRDKVIRYPAALAMAAAGAVTPRVIERLVEAVGETAVRQALIIDDNNATRNEFLEGLAGKGFSVITAGNGPLGLARAKEFPPKDIIVARADMREVTVDAIVRGVKEDPRTAEVPIILIGDREDLEEVAARYEGRVAGVLKLPSDSNALASAIEAVLQPLNASRARALYFSERAAQALVSLDPASLRTHVDALVACLADRPDNVRIAALQVLGKVGATVAVPQVSAVFNDTAASPELRVAAANALAGIFPNLMASPGESVMEGLSAGLEAGENELRQAAARALGAARFLDAEARTRILEGNRVP